MHIWEISGRYLTVLAVCKCIIVSTVTYLCAHWTIPKVLQETILLPVKKGKADTLFCLGFLFIYLFKRCEWLARLCICQNRRQNLKIEKHYWLFYNLIYQTLPFCICQFYPKISELQVCTESFNSAVNFSLQPLKPKIHRTFTPKRINLIILAIQMRQ